MSTPVLQQRLERLNAAIHSGERTVTTSDGASVTYRSLDEMLAARRDLQAKLMQPRTRIKPVVMRASFTTIRGG